MESIAPMSWEDLPAEVLEIICSKIDHQKQLGSLRLVNSSWWNTINCSLTSLTIGKRHVGGDIESLGRAFRRLKDLIIHSDDEDILHKLSSIKSLTQLEFKWCSRDRYFRSNGVELLTHLSELKIESLSHDFEPNFILMLCTLPNLKFLSIYMPLWARDRSIEQQSIKQLPGLTNLTRLDLFNSRFTSMEFLSGLTNLEDLFLFSWMEGRGGNVSPLSSLVNLTSLGLRGCAIGSSAVENLKGLANLKNLTQLGIAKNFLKNGDLAALTGLSKLTELDLSWNEVNDEGFRFLTGLMSLKVLFLNYTQAKNAIQILVPLTGLEVLRLNGTPIKETDLMGLSNLVGLKEVSVCYLTSDMDRQRLERVSAALPHIKFIT